MKKLLNRTLLFGLAIGSGFADPLSLFQGTFATDNQAALFSIMSNTPESITIETYSYGGGPLDTIIPDGGLAPVAFLFDNLSDMPTLIK